MKEVLGELIEFVESFIDDITVHSKTFEEHIEHIKIVLDRLRKAKLKLNSEKCVWCARSVKILGHKVSENEIKMDLSKIEAIKNHLAPKNIKQLQSFLGLCNYYRRFAEKFSYIAQPLFIVLAKDAKYRWSEECEKAFNELKNALTSYPVLRIIDKKKPLKAYTDASGCILTQIDDDGKEYIVACYSRLLNNHEINFSTTEKECLSVIECRRKWRNYGDIELVVDHYALQWLSSIRSSRTACYRPGKNHLNADAISRPVINYIINNDRNDNECVSRDPYENNILYELITTGKERCDVSKSIAIS
ncbi:unnamed protein product [Brachionus calyciflorus]|uniref:Reverse transcriptase/retrotransposon-derived protein RNase H-like domain-containing protein n=1 Tax=Brachionus calyciflorus TaxID=104777 RepID=A0A814LAI6_9BILA|nr:unnamed protein product [Brachionus calyciflorus]